MNEKKRLTYIDCIRIFACLEVVIIHCLAKDFTQAALFSKSWHIMNLFESIIRTCVPLFFMISGALFLNREIPVKVIYRKYVLRVLILFAVWSFIYALYFRELTLVNLISGQFHLWYLYTLAGLYVITPVLKVIVDKCGKYFLLLCFIFAVIIPTMESVILCFDIPFATGMKEVAGKLNIFLPMGYSFYYVLGYYFSVEEWEKKKAVYICGFAGVLLTALLTFFASSYKGAADLTFYEYLTLNVALTAAGLFALFKKTCSEILNVRAKKLISDVSGTTLGIYLVHIIVLDLITRFLGNAGKIITCFGVFIISFLFVLLCKQVPGIRRLVSN